MISNSFQQEKSTSVHFYKNDVIEIVIPYQDETSNRVT